MLDYWMLPVQWIMIKSLKTVVLLIRELYFKHIKSCNGFYQYWLQNTSMDTQVMEKKTPL